MYKLNNYNSYYTAVTLLLHEGLHINKSWYIYFKYLNWKISHKQISNLLLFKIKSKNYQKMAFDISEHAKVFKK